METHTSAVALSGIKKKKMEKAEATLPYIEINHNSLYLFCAYFYPLVYVRYNFKKFFVRAKLS